MNEIETFLGERRADPWFQNHPEVVDRLEGVLKSYVTGEGAEWRAIWDQALAILERTTDTPVDRCQTLALVLEAWMDKQLSWQNHHAIGVTLTLASLV
jgi:hypothetical protein